MRATVALAVLSVLGSPPAEDVVSGATKIGLGSVFVVSGVSGVVAGAAIRVVGPPETEKIALGSAIVGGLLAVIGIGLLGSGRDEIREAFSRPAPAPTEEYWPVPLPSWPRTSTTSTPLRLKEPPARSPVLPAPER